MTATSFDPFRAQARCVWRNRVAQWQRERVQAGVHATALAGLALVLGVPAWQSRATWGTAVADALQQWPGSLFVGVGLAMAAGFADTLRRSAAISRSDWLAAQPVPPSLRARRVRDALARRALGFGLPVVLLLLGARSDVVVLAVFGVAMAIAAGIAWLALRLRDTVGTVSGGQDASTRRNAPAGSRTFPRTWSPSLLVDRGAGRLWRWQKLACGIALRGRTLSWGLLLWLAVPMGSGPGAVIGLGAAGLVLALLSGAWRRSIAVLPQAQAWLASQPLTPARLLRATCALPAALLAVAIASACTALFALGASALALPVAIGLFAFGALQFAAVAATRKQPSRAALLFVVHAVLLLGVLQAFAIAVLPLWMVQMTMLLRQALR